MTAQELEELLADVTPGEWVFGDDPEEPTSDRVSVHCLGEGEFIANFDFSQHQMANVRLFMAAKSLARRVIAAEKLAEALHWVSDNPHAHPSNRQSVVGAALAAWEAAQ